jgi:hypothetical protein
LRDGAGGLLRRRHEPRPTLASVQVQQAAICLNSEEKATKLFPNLS